MRIAGLYDRLMQLLRRVPARVAAHAVDAAAVDATAAARMRLRQGGIVLANAPWLMLANAVNALVLLWADRQGGGHAGILVWSLFITGYALIFGLRSLRLRRAGGPASISPRTMRRIAVNAASLGLLWGALPLLFFAGATPEMQLVIACLCAGMLCGGAFALATVPLAAILFSGLICLGSALGLMAAGEPAYSVVALLLVIYTVVTIRTTLAHAQLVTSNVLAKMETERQRDVIALLLCDFEENASDWLWETDENHCLTHSSARLASVTGRGEDDMLGMPAMAMLPAPADPAFRDGGLDTFASYMEAGEAFRDLVVTVEVGAEIRRWSLTAKPIHDARGAFKGFRGFGTDVTQAWLAERRMAHMALHDGLTDLANRAHFRQRLSEAFAAAEQGSPFAVLFLDLDQFKNVNDTLGHPTGDRLLQAVATRLRHCLAPADTIARLGGDEFAIIRCDASSRETVAAFAGEVLAAFDAPFRIEGRPLACRSSIGIVMAPEDGRDPDTLLKNADMALYNSKAEGRGRFRFFDAAMDHEARDRRMLEIDLAAALDRGELTLHYQPLIDIQRSGICGCEALLRWHHPTRGTVPPAVFIPLAEESGQIVRIGEWVLEQACRDALAWPAHVRIAVNLSVAQFRSPGILVAIMRALESSGLPPGRLEVEVTESILISENEAALATLNAIRRLGVRVALDDFGTGYSSLSYLRQLPLDKIKIDQSFVRDLAEQQDCRAIVDAVIGLAVNLGIAVTAEGVETGEQLGYLRNLGCDQAQGFLISRPQTAEAITLLMQAEAA